MNVFLTGDIGGTNSRFACFQQEGNKLLLESAIAVKTNDFASFEELLNALKENGSQFDVQQHRKFVLAIPGPVTPADVLSFPNIKWAISKSSLKKLYPDTEIFFINDFSAQAYGCLTEAVADALPLIKTEQTRDDIAIVGAGTGLGHGTLKKTAQSGYLHLPSEAGQIPFPFANDEFEQKYRTFIIQQIGIATLVGDDVVSGRGLAILHQFITGKLLSPSEIAAELDATSETTQWFAKFYARVCRNYVLSTLAGGGKLFISGGVAIKNPFLLDNNAFRNEFLQGSDTAQDVLAHIAVSLIHDERIGLFGTAYYASKLVC
ncbi:MAG: glucokinase [Candidatus Electronema aureum]|uniref:Glucokinase n=1 Tax=Candidatus Electronema aureum TaxID=2005002 RepID=A0A521FZV8_9BACT|nr:MAG: glucokinase [Candidatus Electronema aureum]